MKEETGPASEKDRGCIEDRRDNSGLGILPVGQDSTRTSLRVTLQLRIFPGLNYQQKLPKMKKHPEKQ